MRSAFQFPSQFPASPRPLITQLSLSLCLSLCLSLTHTHTSLVQIGEKFLFQLPAYRPGTSFPRMHRGKVSSGDLNTRGPQDPGNSEPLALNQGEVMPRGPVPSGECRGFDMRGGERGGGQKPLALSRLGAQPCSQAASPTGDGVLAGLALSHIILGLGFVRPG